VDRRSGDQKSKTKMKDKKIKSELKSGFITILTSITYLGIAYPGEATDPPQRRVNEENSLDFMVASSATRH